VGRAARMVAGSTRIDGTPVAQGDDGAATAEGFLQSLQRAMTGDGVATVATPFSGPTIPSMLASDLGDDLNGQQVKGVGILEALSGLPVQTAVARPIDGALSDDALDWLAGAGVTAVLGGGDTRERTDEAPVAGGTPPAAPPTATD